MRHTDRDRGRTYFRSQARIFHQDGAWYFATREGDQGPFARRDIARQEAARYTAECASWGAYQTAYGYTDRVNVEPIVTPRNAQRAPRFRSWGRMVFKFS